MQRDHIFISKAYQHTQCLKAIERKEKMLFEASEISQRVVFFYSSWIQLDDSFLDPTSKDLSPYFIYKFHPSHDFLCEPVISWLMCERSKHYHLELLHVCIQGDSQVQQAGSDVYFSPSGNKGNLTIFCLQMHILLMMFLSNASKKKLHSPKLHVYISNQSKKLDFFLKLDFFSVLRGARFSFS